MYPNNDNEPVRYRFDGRHWAEVFRNEANNLPADWPGRAQVQANLRFLGSRYERGEFDREQPRRLTPVEEARLQAIWDAVNSPGYKTLGDDPGGKLRFVERHVVISLGPI